MGIGRRRVRLAMRGGRRGTVLSLLPFAVVVVVVMTLDGSMMDGVGSLRVRGMRMLCW